MVVVDLEEQVVMEEQASEGQDLEEPAGRKRRSARRRRSSPTLSPGLNPLTRYRPLSTSHQFYRRNINYLTLRPLRPTPELRAQSTMILLGGQLRSSLPLLPLLPTLRFPLPPPPPISTPNNPLSTLLNLYDLRRLLSLSTPHLHSLPCPPPRRMDSHHPPPPLTLSPPLTAPSLVDEPTPHPRASTHLSAPVFPATLPCRVRLATRRLQVSRVPEQSPRMGVEGVCILVAVGVGQPIRVILL